MGPQGIPRNRSIEGIRGLLALIVFLTHSWVFFILPVVGGGTSTQRVLELAAVLAVTCFFVLSGYAISLSIGANRARHGAVFSLADYSLSRIFRIVPPLWLVLSITWGLDAALGAVGALRIDVAGQPSEDFTFRPGEALLSLFSLATLGQLTGAVNGPLWTLEWEIRCYVFAGLIACIVAGSHLLKRVAAAAAVVAYAGALGYADPLVLVPVAHVFVQFGLGAAVARVPPGAIGRKELLICAIPLALLTAWVVGSSSGVLLEPGLRPVDLRLEMLVSLWFAGLLTAVSTAPSAGAWAGLGACSYTLYILHFPLEQAARFALLNWAPQSLSAPSRAWVTGLAVTAVTFGVCVAVGTWVERPAAQRVAARGVLQRISRRARRPSVE